MAHDAASLDEYNARNLQRFLSWVTLPVFAFAALFGVVYVLDGTIGIGVLALVVLANGGVFLLARRFVRSGALKQAAALICAGLLAIVVIAAVFAPIAPLGLAIQPLLIAA